MTKTPEQMTAAELIEIPRELSWRELKALAGRTQAERCICGSDDIRPDLHGRRICMGCGRTQ